MGFDMGGYGSGRRWRSNAKNTTEDIPALDVRELHRKGVLTFGRVFRYGWCSGGRETLAALVRSDNNLVEVYPLIKEDDGGEQTGPPHLAPLSITPCHYGGIRVWFHCPQCSRRVAILYVTKQLACRHCLQLRYKSQREVDYLRAARLARKLNLRLGGTGVVEKAPARPKGMHWKTYQLLANEAHELRLKAWAGVAGKLSL